jgi:lipopolysaccharide biosynthesis glycosyltransferase
MDTIYVVLATDENYAQHAGITLLSLLQTKKSLNPISVNIIDDGLSEDTRNKLKKIADGYGAILSFLYVNADSLLNNLFGCKRAIYYRLAIPDLLPAEVNKALYIDVDLIIRHDITELWNTDISNYYLGAVTDIADKQDLDKLKRNIGIPESELYFNSGVLLINNQKWRQDHIGEQVARFVFENRPLQEDQDGLNAIVWGKWLPLNPKWNVARQAFRQYCHFKTRRTLSEDIKKAVLDPSAAHFTGSIKPWHYACHIPYAEEYTTYLAQSPWRDYQPPDKNLRNMLKKHWKKLRYSLLLH